MDTKIINELKANNLIGRYISKKTGEETFEIEFESDKKFTYDFLTWGCIYKQFSGDWEINNKKIILHITKKRDRDCSQKDKLNFTDWESIDMTVMWNVCLFYEYERLDFKAENSNVIFQMKYYRE